MTETPYCSKSDAIALTNEFAKRLRATTERAGPRPPLQLLLCLAEIAQNGWCLALARRHHVAIRAQQVGVVADHDVAVALGTDDLAPDRPRIGIAAVAPDHRPRTRQGIVNDGDFVVQQVAVGSVELDSFLD